MNSNKFNLSVHPIQTDIEKHNDKEYGEESDIKTTNKVFWNNYNFYEKSRLRMSAHIQHNKAI